SRWLALSFGQRCSFPPSRFLKERPMIRLMIRFPFAGLLVRVLALGLLMSFALSAVLAQDKEANGDMKLEGTLSEDDPKNKVLKKSPHKVHEYKMKTVLTALG